MRGNCPIWQATGFVTNAILCVPIFGESKDGEDEASAAVTRKFGGFYYPRHIAVPPEGCCNSAGGYALVANGIGDCVSRIDLTSGKVTQAFKSFRIQVDSKEQRILHNLLSKT